MKLFTPLCSVLLTLCLISTFNVLANQIIFGTEEYGPYSYIDKKTGEMSGLAIELIQAIQIEARTLDSKIEFLPWPRLYKMAQEQENVAIFSIARTKQRESAFKWVGTLYKAESYLWKFKSRTDISLKSINDISKYTTIVTNGGVDQAYFESLNIDANLYAVKGQKERLLMVYLGRGDLFEDNELSVKWESRNQRFDFSDLEVALHEPLSSVELSLAFSVHTKDVIVNKYREAMQRVKDKGIYARIIKKWAD